MLVKLNIDNGVLKADAVEALAILNSTDNMVTAKVCSMFLELVENIESGILPQNLKLVVKTREEELRDSIDRPDRHNINSANRPSVMQQVAFEKENEDEV